MDKKNEIIVKSIRAYDKECIGCQNHQKALMITYIPEGKSDIIDLFLDEKQAEHLYKEIGHRLINP